MKENEAAPSYKSLQESAVFNLDSVVPRWIKSYHAM